MGEKTYIGYRTEGPEGPRTQVSTIEGDGMKELPLRLDLWNHSPTGFEWGYGGSGPAQLALAILAEATGDGAYARAWHQAFKREVIARLHLAEWRITEAEVLAWVTSHPLPEDERFPWLSPEQQVQILDREIVAEMESECCGAPCYYQASFKDGRYEPVAICARCGSATEF
jgi:hypothetical protein